VDDRDPGVRKAAIESLGRVGDVIAAQAAGRLLGDPVPFVRAHAARALGDLDRPESAASVAALLGDADWWVRHAAKQSLESMGADVWPVLVRCLDHTDRFVRNGAAEVFQNIGVLDSFIVMEAASDDPSQAKVELLRRIASAGGARLTESLVERAGPKTGARVRRLLETVGLEHVGAA
jgi:HEAT repeat protein